MRNPRHEQDVYLRRASVKYQPHRREGYNRGVVTGWWTRLCEQWSYIVCLASLLYAALLVANVMMSYMILSEPGSGEVRLIPGVHLGIDHRLQMPKKRIGVSANMEPKKSISRIGVFLPLVGLKQGTGSNTTRHQEQLRQVESLALQGWRLAAEVLHTNPSSRFELYIYGLVERPSHCNPIWNSIAGPHFQCMALPARCFHADYANIPTIDCILTTMAEVGRDSQYDHVVLANGDLLFPPYDVAALMQSIAQLHEQDIVVIGQRIDTTWEDFGGHQIHDMEKGGRHLSLDTYVSLHDAAHAPGRGAMLHPDFGVDYFIMSTSAVPVDFPPFLVGRFRWDNALLAQFLVATENVTVVDATAVLPVLHVGATYSSDPGYHYNRSGAGYNDALANQHFGESYKLGRIRNAAWRLQDARNRSEQRRYVVQPRAPQDRPDHKSLHAISRAGEGPLFLIPVLPHELVHALEWLEVANQTQTSSFSCWFHTHYLFVALDRETYDVLEGAAPGCIILEDMTGWPRPPTALGWKSFGQLVELRRMPVAILTATQLHDMNREGVELDEYAEKASRCGAVVLRDTKELFSVQPRVRPGMTFWGEYKDNGGQDVNAQLGACLV